MTPALRRVLIAATVLAAIGAIALAAVWANRDRPELFDIRVIEGTTVPAMLDTLSSQTGFTVAEYRAVLLDGSVTSSLLPRPPATLTDWEGLLFPDTYEVRDNDGPAQILQRLANTAVARVGSIDWSYAESRGLSVYDGIVVASMIEREAGTDADRPLIASVIYNRLAIDMRLQIDATVIYALGYYPSGGLTFDDLEVDSPYNTYRVAGLPPTPIAGVRLASLQAAAAPAETDFLFYVLASPDGSHEFTRTYEEHLAAIERSRAAGVLP